MGFFDQTIEMHHRGDRVPYFQELCRDKRVLHVGCTDSPIFDAATNLHLQLAPVCKELHGMDVDENGLSELNDYFKGEYFTHMATAVAHSKQKSNEVVLAPETIEHHPNIQ